ncbi:hypothetical protein GCM10009087_22600 [Sphingomonas oligophenolica]|uniref:Secreted protein n=1 Tax=Sphingomonas oligophenolica TaxID=301154 RepID=A0ABU9Y1R4_9SPHN
MLGLLLIIAGQSADVDAALAHYHAVTAVGPRCGAAANPSDVVVCARRGADRYRVPLIEYDAGNPKNQGVPAERERMLARTSNCREKSVFLVGCGSVGVGTRATFGPDGIQGARVRPLAD